MVVATTAIVTPRSGSRRWIPASWSLSSPAREASSDTSDGSRSRVPEPSGAPSRPSCGAGNHASSSRPPDSVARPSPQAPMFVSGGSWQGR